MHKIDFLPAEYRQNQARRQSQLWRVVVVLSFFGLVTVAAFGQHHRRGQLRAELAALAPEEEAVEIQKRCLGDLQSQLQQARADADLFTYLRHPWPRTRIIEALLGPLPDEITFEKLEIREEKPAGRGAEERVSPAERQAEQEKLATLPPAAQDLARLRRLYDAKQTIVTVNGVASDSAALHRYLGDLSRVDLFSKVELATIEADQIDQQARLRFTATLVVRPGYGQPGGPTAEAGASSFSFEPKTT